MLTSGMKRDLKADFNMHCDLWRELEKQKYKFLLLCVIVL